MCGPASYLSCDRRSLVDVRTGETAIQKGLAHRLEQLSIERQRRDRANARADEEFSAEFLSAARAVFLMIDKDDSGFLDKEEMSARCVRPSTCARRGDGARSAAALAVRRVWGGSSYAIDATRRLPRDPPAASTPSEATRR